jgi:hypothetical protein
MFSPSKAFFMRMIMATCNSTLPHHEPVDANRAAYRNEFQELVGC